MLTGGHMRIRQKEKEGVKLFFVSGEINLNTVSELKKAFKRLLKEKRDKILLDFKDVEYIDSTGLASLIELSNNLKELHGVVVLSNLSLKIRSIFDITKLEKAFKIFENDEEALRYFRSR